MHHPLRAVLNWAGRNGPLLLFAGVLVGLVAPSLAHAARPLFGFAVFVFTLGAFLKVDLVSFRVELQQRSWIAVVLLWTTFGVPLVMFVLVRLLQPETALAQAMMLCMLAPPVGSAAAIAAMLGLSAPLALLATVSAMLLSPLYLPLLATWLGSYQLQIDPLAMMQRLLVIVGGAGVCATLLHRHARNFIAQNPHAMTGISVFGLILVAVGAMRGMQNYFLVNPREVLSYLMLAFVMNVGFQAMGAALFSFAGPVRALTIGLVSGNRSVTLAWAAAGSSLAGNQQVELYLAMSVFPIFMLPLLERRLIERMLSAKQARSTLPRPRA